MVRGPQLPFKGQDLAVWNSLLNGVSAELQPRASTRRLEAPSPKAILRQSFATDKMFNANRMDSFKGEEAERKWDTTLRRVVRRPRMRLMGRSFSLRLRLAGGGCSQARTALSLQTGNFPPICWREPKIPSKRERSSRSKCITLCFGPTAARTSAAILAGFRPRATAKDMSKEIARDRSRGQAQRATGVRTVAIFGLGLTATAVLPHIFDFAMGKQRNGPGRSATDGFPQSVRSVRRTPAPRGRRRAGELKFHWKGCSGGDSDLDRSLESSS